MPGKFRKSRRDARRSDRSRKNDRGNGPSNEGAIGAGALDPHSLEHLEQRRMLSADVSGGGNLEIEGTSANDAIVIESGDDDGVVRVFGVDGVEDGTVFEGVRRVRVNTGEGDDSVEFRGSFVNEKGREMAARVRAGDGDDTVLGSDTVDRFKGGDGNDMLDGGSRGDDLRGDKGDDTLVGGSGHDRLSGGLDDDDLDGGEGDDRLKGNGGDDDLDGEEGDDDARGGSGRDLLRGGDGDDRLNGNGGDDDLFGDDGDDDFKGRDDEAMDREDGEDDDDSSEDDDSSDDDDSDDSSDDDDDDSDDSSDDDDDDSDDSSDDDDDDSDDSSDDDFGLDDEFVGLLSGIESQLGELPSELVALRDAAVELNAVAGPAMKNAERMLKNFFTDDQLEALVGDDPWEDSSDGIVEALDRFVGSDDEFITDFDNDGVLLDFDDLVSAYDLLISQVPEAKQGVLIEAANTLISNMDLARAVEEAFQSLISADLGQDFWSLVSTLID